MHSSSLFKISFFRFFHYQTTTNVSYKPVSINCDLFHSFIVHLDTTGFWHKFELNSLNLKKFFSLVFQAPWEPAANLTSNDCDIATGHQYCAWPSRCSCAWYSRISCQSWGNSGMNKCTSFCARPPIWNGTCRNLSSTTTCLAFARWQKVPAAWSRGLSSDQMAFETKYSSVHLPGLCL